MKYISHPLNSTVREAISAQRQYCERNRVPLFAPPDGICDFCHLQIYGEVEHVNPFNGEKSYTRITPEQAGSTLVTGCPHCHHSYCD